MTVPSLRLNEVLRGIEMVTLSAGADGLWLAARDQIVHTSPPRVNRHNPVGNGDAMMAGLIWVVENNFAISNIACWATACGTASAIADGVNFGSLADFEALSKKISVEAIKKKPAA